ncbi:hypothetical protein CE91St30_29540 [Raoultibacter timonensis]|uniref:Uncharacterized protein n=1 Tax=Raoultibacter timonensis TaxID=1907662 RepID=A0ABM7WMJ7_9ACTN|nr:hypothetical protein CE91St30_29540 [Raoultibacter timonensis]BDF52224.1 hypothetical protein CE91St31_29540 [Raoultibacter timonensis]
MATSPSSIIRFASSDVMLLNSGALISPWGSEASTASVDMQPSSATVDAIAVAKIATKRAFFKAPPFRKYLHDIAPTYYRTSFPLVNAYSFGGIMIVGSTHPI